MGAISLVVGLGLRLFKREIPLGRWFAGPFLGCGSSMMLTGSIMLWGSRVGKQRLRDRLLARIPWRGDEQVLDVGCGHGLMLLAAARRLKTGKAVGVDLWQTQDQAGNSREATLANATLEGVRERVELHDGDARKLPFVNGSFDRVLSSWALHNIYDAAGRRLALAEIARVLKPGGQVLILDIRHAQEYASAFAALGMEDVRLEGPNFIFVIPTRWVTARKPRNPKAVAESVQGV